MCKHEEKILHKLWNAKKDELNLTKHKDKKLHHKKVHFIKEPYGLPFELTEKDKFKKPKKHKSY